MRLHTPVSTQPASGHTNKALYQMLANEQSLSDITKLAAFICDTPIAMVSLADQEELTFIAKQGAVVVNAAPRKGSFCAQAMNCPDSVLVIPDATLDSRFSDHPLVINNPGHKFYAGAPLVTAEGQVIGTICVFDYTPKDLDQRQIESLQALSRQVIAMMELQKLTRQLHQTSMTDALTGVCNRRAFDLRLHAEFERWQRTNQPFMLALIDVDHFKSFNDSFGHAAGDAALRAIANVFQQHHRSYDFFGRYGGEEFALILSATDPHQALLKLEKLRMAVAQANWPLRPLTVSIGLASSGHFSDPKHMLEAADSALYKAKHLGRDQCCLNSTN